MRETARSTGHPPATALLLSAYPPRGLCRQMRRAHLLVLILLAAALLAAGCASRTAEPGSAAPGNVIIIKGSDTLVNVALAWAEEYMKRHPEVSISVTGGGSGTGLTGILNGTVDIANASRRIKQEELDQAAARNLKPIEYTVALDAIAIVVNPSNPVNQLSLQQLSDIYTGKITNWRELGGEDRPIVLLSRESNSGTYTYFLENVVRMGDPKSELLFAPETLLMPSSEGISVEVRQNPNAIGYDGLGYVTDDQKVIAVARDQQGPYVLPSVETVNDQSYPISRALFMYTPNPPEGQIKAYIDWILGDGQSLISGLGFVPLANKD